MRLSRSVVVAWIRLLFFIKTIFLVNEHKILDSSCWVVKNLCSSNDNWNLCWMSKVSIGPSHSFLIWLDQPIAVAYTADIVSYRLSLIIDQPSKTTNHRPQNFQTRSQSWSIGWGKRFGMGDWARKGRERQNKGREMVDLATYEKPWTRARSQVDAWTFDTSQCAGRVSDNTRCVILCNKSTRYDKSTRCILRNFCTL